MALPFTNGAGAMSLIERIKANFKKRCGAIQKAAIVFHAPTARETIDRDLEVILRDVQTSTSTIDVAPLDLVI